MNRTIYLPDALGAEVRAADLSRSVSAICAAALAHELKQLADRAELPQHD